MHSDRSNELIRVRTLFGCVSPQNLRVSVLRIPSTNSLCSLINEITLFSLRVPVFNWDSENNVHSAKSRIVIFSRSLVDHSYPLLSDPSNHSGLFNSAGVDDAGGLSSHLAVGKHQGHPGTGSVNLDNSKRKFPHYFIEIRLDPLIAIVKRMWIAPDVVLVKKWFFNTIFQSTLQPPNSPPHSILLLLWIETMVRDYPIIIIMQLRKRG